MTGAAPWHPRLKALLFALLVCNAAIFSITGTLGEAMDSVAWLTLLALFELETAYGDRLRGSSMTVLVRATRIVAAIAVLAAAARYLQERAWLDAVNAWIWIAVVVMLEAEVRLPEAVARHRDALRVLAATLYGALALLVVIWAWQGAWFDAYDAALWIAAFVAIEINVLSRA